MSSSSVSLDTARDVYLNEDLLQDLSDLVIYTKPVRFPTLGFKVTISPSQSIGYQGNFFFQYGVNMKSTEMYSVAEPLLRKAAKRNPRELSLQVVGGGGEWWEGGGEWREGGGE